MSDYEADARARLSTKEGRIEAITQRAYSRRFGSGNSNYIRECADDEYELLGFLADAEQRAERLADALEDAHSTLYTLSQMAHNWAGMGTAEQYKAMVDQNVIRASRARKRIHAALTALDAYVSKPTNDAPACDDDSDTAF